MRLPAKSQSKGIHLLVNNGACAWCALWMMLITVQLALHAMTTPNTPTANQTSVLPKASPIIFGRVSPKTGRKRSKRILPPNSSPPLPSYLYLPKAAKQPPGYSSSVVNIASISGVMKGSSNGQFAYATSKAGMCAEFGVIP